MESAAGKQKGFFHILRRNGYVLLKHDEDGIFQISADAFQLSSNCRFRNTFTSKRKHAEMDFPLLSSKFLRLVIDFIGINYIVTDLVPLMSEAGCQTQRIHTDYSMDRIDEYADHFPPPAIMALEP
ncbi:hypothetical protein ROZALSC1DRAFT_21280 [Rozella allomycis CSF55]|uniref:Uncharacterized protein n=1 Tax=Rozella allomycis (strain CSF55) TaxID=988480 RepID=A0A4P9YM12_ROZAC|nr:hypothetical protein ROZALSC1DRAFT_21280 [Rozella allomycis CSF55]